MESQFLVPAIPRWWHRSRRNPGTSVTGFRRGPGTRAVVYARCVLGDMQMNDAKIVRNCGHKPLVQRHAGDYGKPIVSNIDCAGGTQVDMSLINDKAVESIAEPLGSRRYREHLDGSSWKECFICPGEILDDTGAGTAFRPEVCREGICRLQALGLSVDGSS